MSLPKSIIGKGLLCALSLSAGLVSPICAQNMPQPAPAYNPATVPPAAGDSDPDSPGISMTMFRVVKSPTGQEFYLDNNNQAQGLPGAGVTTDGVGIYTAPDGSRWYIDSTGSRQNLPPLSGYAYQSSQDYSWGSPYAGSPGYGSDDSNDSNSQTPVVNNYYNNSSSSSGGGSSGSGSGAAAMLGTAAGMVGGMAMGMAMDSVPYGVPMYYGSRGPYYWGGSGNRVYVNNQNFNQYNREFNEQNNNWHQNNVNHWNSANHWNNHFDPNNWNHHWGNNNWPGKDHGFPPPWKPSTGRMYSPEQQRADSGAAQGFNRSAEGFNRSGQGQAGQGFSRAGQGMSQERSGGMFNRGASAGGGRFGGGGGRFGGGGGRFGGRR